MCRTCKHHLAIRLGISISRGQLLYSSDGEWCRPQIVSLHLHGVSAIKAVLSALQTWRWRRQMVQQTTAKMLRHMRCVLLMHRTLEIRNRPWSILHCPVRCSC